MQKWYSIFKDHITLEDYEIHDGMGLELYYNWNLWVVIRLMWGQKTRNCKAKNQVSNHFACEFSSGFWDLYFNQSNLWLAAVIPKITECCREWPLKMVMFTRSRMSSDPARHELRFCPACTWHAFLLFSSLRRSESSHSSGESPWLIREDKYLTCW